MPSTECLLFFCRLSQRCSHGYYVSVSILPTSVVILLLIVVWRTKTQIQQRSRVDGGDRRLESPTAPCWTEKHEYRLRIGNRVKYLVVSPGTFGRDTLSLPLQSLPPLPCNEEWTVASISRDNTSGDLKTSLSNRKLAGVKNQWHHTTVDCLGLERTKQLTASAFEAISHSALPTTPSPSLAVIAKIARF